MNNNTYSNKYKSKQVSKVLVKYDAVHGDTYIANEGQTMYLRENKDNIYISLREKNENGESVTEHAKIFKKDIVSFTYSEMPYVESEKKEEENEEL